MRELRVWPAIGLVCLLLGLSAPVLAASRVALVIGNDAYEHLPPLANAANDANALDRRLTELGFETVRLINGDLASMYRAIDAFIATVDPGGTALVFYAGHGIEAKGRNYLIPVDTDMRNEADLRWGAVALDGLMDDLATARAAVNLVFLDACRDNPLPETTRSVSRGLARVSAPKGTLIAYAARPGEVALDGKPGGHGVFTGALLEALEQPGLTVEQVIKRAAVNVRTRTNGRQEPWLEGLISGEFYFVDPPAPPVQAATPTAWDNRRADLMFWEEIRDSTRVGAFEDYLETFPSGIFAPIAKRRIAAMSQATASIVDDPTLPSPAPDAPSTEEPVAQVSSTQVPATQVPAAQAPSTQAPSPQAPSTLGPAPHTSPAPTAATGEPAQLAALPPASAPLSEDAPIVPPDPEPTVLEVDEPHVTVTRSNLRAEPTTDAAIVTTLAIDTLVRVTGRLADGRWLRLLYDGTPAWIWSDLVEPIDPTEHATWRRLRRGTEADIEAFLAAHKNGHYEAAARDRLTALVAERERREAAARAREAAEAARKAREEAERQAAADALRKAQDEAEAKRQAAERAREAAEAARRAREEAERQAAADALRKAQEEAEAKRQAAERARAQREARARAEAARRALEEAEAQRRAQARADAERRAQAAADAARAGQESTPQETAPQKTTSQETTSQEPAPEPAHAQQLASLTDPTSPSDAVRTGPRTLVLQFGGEIGQTFEVPFEAADVSLSSSIYPDRGGVLWIKGRLVGGSLDLEIAFDSTDGAFETTRDFVGRVSLDGDTVRITSSKGFTAPEIELGAFVK